MATTYDKASLVMLPSGYKDDKLYSVKPTDGSGDFTFSRDGSGASPATRVNASGYIEKGRTNELTYSNDFSNAAWVKLGAGTATAASVTSGFSDPDGGSNAWRLQCDLNGGTTSSDQSLIYQLGSGAGLYTYSFYVKSNTGASQNFAFGNDLNGYDTAVATTSWQRFEFFKNSASTHNAFIGSRGTTGSDDTLDILIYAAQVEQGLVATDYIETTTTAVSAGLLGDMPRLDYSGGATCPSLLLEPSRVNLIDQSEHAGAWSATNVTHTQNYGISPEGVSNSVLIESTSTSGGHYFGAGNMSITSGTTYAASVFVKQGTARYFQLLFGGSAFGTQSYANFDLQEGLVTAEGTNIDAKIESYENNWYRVSIVGPATATATESLYGAVITSATAARVQSHTSVLNCEVYGVMCEAGSYPTSYIPTYGSAASRADDECEESGVSDLIGQTEGTMFVEAKVRFDVTNGRLLLIGQLNDFIELVAITSKKIRAFVWNGSQQAEVDSSTTYDNGDTLKIAFAYKANDFVLYVNGVQEGTDTSGAIPSAMAKIILNNYTAAGYNTANAYKQALLFKTRLTNAELASLTTI